MKCCNELSKPISISRGVHQWSVFSDFVVMDSLLQELHQSGGGLPIDSLTFNSAAHVDDIGCVISDSPEGLQK